MYNRSNTALKNKIPVCLYSLLSSGSTSIHSFVYVVFFRRIRYGPACARLCPACRPHGGGLADDKPGPSIQDILDLTPQGSLFVQERFSLQGHHRCQVPSSLRAKTHLFLYLLFHHNLLLDDLTPGKTKSN